MLIIAFNLKVKQSTNIKFTFVLFAILSKFSNRAFIRFISNTKLLQIHSLFFIIH